MPARAIIHAAEPRPTPKREALYRLAAEMRAHRTPSTMPRPAEPRAKRIVGWFLEIAYMRQCFVCGKSGTCPHREPEVEHAILKYREVE
jgi:hypothetical protein